MSRSDDRAPTFAPSDAASAPSERGPTGSASLGARDVRFHVHPQTNLHAHLSRDPLVITRGEGVRVFDERGRSYIDAMAGLWSACLGFSERRLADAAHRQMLTLPYASTFAHRTHPPAIELAERLVAVAPPGLTRVSFANSGSEAIDTAIKLVWYVQNARGRPTKKKIIARERAYHGSTIMAASLTGLPRMQQGFDLPVPGIVVRAACPHFSRLGRDGESEEDFARRMVAELGARVEAEGPDTIGAFFAEPIQGAGGVIVPPRGYFEGVQALCRRHGILFVADEVICGFGRTGAMWGSERFGLAPDMMTCAKGLSSSYLPISALLMTDEVFEDLRRQSEAIGQFGHGFTYSGHPVAAAVALETLRIFEEEGLATRAAALEPHLFAGLRHFETHPLVGEVRGAGLIAGVELMRNPARREPFDPALGVGVRVQDAAQRRGVLLRALGDTVAFCPPLTVTKDEIGEVVGAFGEALEEVASALP